MQVRLEGEANDYVGKGMNSGCITLVPSDGCASPGDQVILGNTCLYGATGGELFAHGRAGERFGVRNSGARTVVEGAGDHCCEYMTGGVVVVLGSTGRNVGAGMTGGVTFLLDEEGRVAPRVNPEIVEVCTITTHEQESLLKGLLERHVALTGSEKAAALLADWSAAKGRFKVLVPPVSGRRWDWLTSRLWRPSAVPSPWPGSSRPKPSRPSPPLSPLSSGDPPWRLTAIGFQRKLQQAAVYAAATWWMAIGIRAAGVC